MMMDNKPTRLTSIAEGKHCSSMYNTVDCMNIPRLRYKYVHVLRISDQKIC